MRSYRVLDHTADIGFEAFGRTLEEVFANAAKALTDLMIDLESIEPRGPLWLELEGTDPASLLVNWLSEVLYRFDAERWVAREFEIREFSDCALRAVARGETFDPSRHAVKLMVKAITYHKLEIRQAAKGWQAQVYVDI